MDFDIQKCLPPTVATDTIEAMIRVESGFSKNAIALIKGSNILSKKELDRLYQFNFLMIKFIVKKMNDDEFLVVWSNQSFNPTDSLLQDYLVAFDLINANFSIGLGQINKSNFKKYNIDPIELFNDPCENLKVAAKILGNCLENSPNQDIFEAFSCYYSGNYKRGFKKDYNNTSYVDRIKNASAVNEIKIPSIKVALKNNIQRNDKYINKKEKKFVPKKFVKNYNIVVYKNIAINNADVMGIQ